MWEKIFEDMEGSSVRSDGTTDIGALVNVLLTCREYIYAQ